MKKLTTIACLIALAVAGYQAMAAEDESAQLWKFNTQDKVLGALLETAQNQFPNMPSYDSLTSLAEAIFSADNNALKAFNVNRKDNSTIVNHKVFGGETVVSVEWTTKYSMAGSNNKWTCKYKNDAWTITPPEPFHREDQ